MRKRIRYTIFIVLIALVLTAFTDPSSASDQQTKSTLKISMPSYGRILLEGDIAAGDRIRLFNREYRSAAAMITDKLLSDTVAEKDGRISLEYNTYSLPLSETQIKPDFSYNGSDIVIQALYGVVSDGESEVRSDLFYTECFMETSVINQFWSTYHGSSSCGTAAGVIAIQPVYPSWGDEMYIRMNKMRDYCIDGDDYCTGAPRYETVGKHITNSVNRYITEELHGTELLSDHKSADKSMQETLIDLLTTGRPAVVEVCYLRGAVTEDFWGISHWVVINGFFLVGNDYWFRYSDPVTVSYVGISSDFLEKSNKNVSYAGLPYTYERYIGAFTDPLFSIE